MFEITIRGFKMTFTAFWLFRKNYKMLRKIFTGATAAGLAIALTQDNMEVLSTDNIIQDIIAENILHTRLYKD